MEHSTTFAVVVLVGIGLAVGIAVEMVAMLTRRVRWGWVFGVWVRDCYFSWACFDESSFEVAV